MNIKCDELLSSFAFNFKLRPYPGGSEQPVYAAARQGIAVQAVSIKTRVESAYGYSF
jgi:hypothetical protein